MDINILLFQDFEALDAFGPVEILAQIKEYHLRFISFDGGIIRSKQGVDIATEPIANADYSGVLLIPGGWGARALVADDESIQKLTEIASLSEYCLTVCTGSAPLAKTGLLNGRRATSNKQAFNWVKSVNPDVQWIGHARWVVDGKFYTASGVSAGMDMALGFVADRFGAQKAKEIADYIEYLWNSDPDHDLFAV